MSRLGVIGTMVWDTIYGRGVEDNPVQEWGGISYGLAALEAALPAEWEIVPLIKVGRDMARAANEFLESLTRRSAAARFVEVPEPNNRVTLRYETSSRRCEKLTGGVPPWTWDELGPMVSDLDAIYLNFISGFELDLETAKFLRSGFRGPIYADLHSLLLGVARDGTRIPQSLSRAASWFSCFDVVQLNEDEMNLIGGDPMEVAATVLDEAVGLLVVTLGPSGAAYFAAPSFAFGSREFRRPTGPEPIATAVVPAPVVAEGGDPTGCGDVFGATLLGQLIRGASIPDAIRDANAGAARNVSARGATGLQYHLRNEIAPQ